MASKKTRAELNKDKFEKEEQLKQDFKWVNLSEAKKYEKQGLIKEVHIFDGIKKYGILKEA